MCFVPDPTTPAAGSVPQRGVLPTDSVGFTLSQLGLEVSRRFGEVVAALGLEPRHFALLRGVSRWEGEAQQVIADRLQIPASTMVAVVDHLERDGLVERRPHPSDRRARNLYMTPAGRERVEEATASAMGLESTVCSGLTASEREALLALLRRVAANLDIPYWSLPDHGLGERPPGI